MSEIKVFDSQLQETAALTTAVDLSQEAIHEAAVHQVVKATLAGRRQGTACTKTRGLVSGGGAKPFKQKGTGRARQGSTRSPLQVGGGTIFGPRPRDFSQKVNKKLASKAVQAILADKFQSGKLITVEELPSSGKTKEMAQWLKGHNLESCLVVAQDEAAPALRAVRNLAKGKGLAASGFSVYEAVRYEHLIIEKAALEAILERPGLKGLGRKKR